MVIKDYIDEKNLEEEDNDSEDINDGEDYDYTGEDYEKKY